jgi:hypothetical protein
MDSNIHDDLDELQKLVTETSKSESKKKRKQRKKQKVKANMRHHTPLREKLGKSL